MCGAVARECIGISELHNVSQAKVKVILFFIYYCGANGEL